MINLQVTEVSGIQGSLEYLVSVGRLSSYLLIELIVPGIYNGSCGSCIPNSAAFV